MPAKRALVVNIARASSQMVASFIKQLFSDVSEANSHNLRHHSGGIEAEQH